MICTFSPSCGTNTTKNALTEYELWLFKITKIPPFFFLNHIVLSGEPNPNRCSSPVSSADADSQLPADNKQKK